MVTRKTLKQGQIWLCELDPTRGSEIQKTRPCLIVSPDELNRKLSTFIIVPMTTGNKLTPFRVSCRFENKDGMLLPDQMRSIDYRRAVKLLGMIDTTTLSRTLAILRELFEELE